MASQTFETLDVEYIGDHIAHVKLNRPKQGNAMNVKMVHEFPAMMQFLSKRENLRCVMITGNGKHFSSGVDLQDPVFNITIEQEDIARRAIFLYDFIKVLQETVTSFEKIQVPVLVGIHNACIGLACEFSLAADYRICTKQSFFEFKEVDVAIAADMGLLQRLPVTCSNDSLIRQLVFTGERFNAETAQKLGMVSEVVEDEAAMRSTLLKVAQKISEKSPVAIWTIKSILNHQRHKIILPNLEYMARINTVMAQTSDIPTALGALVQKEKPIFPKL